MKFESALLNAALKKLDADWDFTVLVNPLLADQGPAIAVVPKRKRQIERMIKLIDEFLQKKQADFFFQGRLSDAPAGPLLRREEETKPAEFLRTDQGRPPAAPAQTVGGSMPPNRTAARAAARALLSLAPTL